MKGFKPYRQRRSNHDCLVVEGAGPFPIDMLRFEGVCPYREEDSYALDAYEIGRGYIKRRIYFRAVPGGVRHTLAEYEERWKSFGWRVVHRGTFLQCKRAAEQLVLPGLETVTKK